MATFGGFQPGTYQAWALNLVDSVVLSAGVGRGLQVTQTVSPSLAVLVGVDATFGDGVCVLPNGGWVRIDAPLTLSVAGNSSGSTRNDAVVATMDPTSNTATLQYIINWAGGFTGGTVNQFVVATIAVPNGASTIINAYITMNTALAGVSSAVYATNLTGSASTVGGQLTIGDVLYVNGNSLDIFGVRSDPSGDNNPGIKLSNTSGTLDIVGGYSAGFRFLLNTSASYTVLGTMNQSGAMVLLGQPVWTSPQVQGHQLFTGTVTPVGAVEGDLWLKG